MSEKIYIFDTTLRDGEQSPGASMNLEEKMQIRSQEQNHKNGSHTNNHQIPGIPNFGCKE